MFFRPAEFDLARCSTAELERLNGDERALDAFLHRFAPIDSLRKTPKVLLERQNELAKRNLQLEPIFLRERDELIRLHKLLKSHRDRFVELKAKFDGADFPSAELVLVQLRSFVEHHEQFDDELIEKFLRRKSPADDELEQFNELFLQQRKETILLKFFAEKFFELYQTS